MKSERFRPYIRRANGREMATTMRMAVRLAFYRTRGRPFYVMVQRGFPSLVLECQGTRRELERSPLPVATGNKSFREWSRSAMGIAQGPKKKKGGR